MHFEETLDVAASREQAWELFWQPQRLAKLIPGCSSVEEIEPQQRYKAMFDDSVGPYKLHFDMDVRVVETQPQERITIEANGKDARLGVTQKLALGALLQDQAPGRTRIDVSADLEILGKVATLGQFVIKRKAKSVVEQLARNIERELSNG